jgi:AbrB family looped-hinge helix DNA binding protein
MQITKISPKRQITIPKGVSETLHLEIGDFLEVGVTEEGLLLIPKKLISKDQTWFWAKEWQQKEKEADEAIAEGEVLGPFRSGHELIRHLRKNR